MSAPAGPAPVYVAWADRVSIAAGIAAVGASLGFTGPHAWVTSRALTVPLMIAPSIVWGVAFLLGGCLVLLGAMAGLWTRRGRGLRVAGHLVLALTYLVFFGTLLAAWVITLAQWLQEEPVDGTLLPYGAAPWLPLLAVVVHAACAVWLRPRRTEQVVRVVE